jgi:hypothetical protein
MPQKDFAASRFEGAQIKRGRVVDPSRPRQSDGIVIEVEAESITFCSIFASTKYF